MIAGKCTQPEQVGRMQSGGKLRVSLPVDGGILQVISVVNIRLSSSIGNCHEASQITVKEHSFKMSRAIMCSLHIYCISLKRF